MNFSEQPPSQQWAALKYRGEVIAEVWFKPEGQPFGLTFRIPSQSFQIPGVGPRLTAELLLKAVAVAPEEVESWRHAGLDGSNPELRQPLLPPPPDLAYLEIHVALKPPPSAAAPEESAADAIPAATWQELEARWRTVEGLEATLDSIRLRMEGLRAEMEGSATRGLTAEDKAHALNADVAQWTKAKSRVHFTVPKAKEFIHRATWAMGAHERKQLGELFKNSVRPQLPAAEVGKVREQLESLIKARQILSAQGTTVYQECESVFAEMQGALRTLQSNATANARRKMGATRAKGKRL